MSHGGVLTSIDNVLIMEENEIKKKMEVMRKEEKNRVRDSKKAGKVALKSLQVSHMCCNHTDFSGSS